MTHSARTRDRRCPRSAAIIPLLVLLLTLTPGCAAWVALSMPGPAKDDQIAADMHRSHVENTLSRSPTSMFENDGIVEARYEYPDGPPAWSKLRSLIYVGGDLFTLFLSELIFWPIELHARGQIQRVAVAEYSADNKLASWTVRRQRGGEMLFSQRSMQYDEYALAAKGGGAPAGAPPSNFARVTSPPPPVSSGNQRAIFAPSSVSTQRENVEFQVAILDTNRYKELLVDGQAVQPAADGSVIVSRSVPVGQSNILLSAIDATGAGFVQRVSVTRSIPDDRAASSLRLGNYYALVIGNDRYTALQPLKTARADAEAMAVVLRDQYGFEVELLLDATRSQIVSTLANYRKTLGPGDNLLVYYAGHGIRDESEDHGYWLPVDADADNPSQWIANASITRQLKAMPAKHVLVIADSCYSGTLTRGIVVADRAPGYLIRLAERRSRTALTSGGVEPVSDAGSGANSVFAFALLQELRANQGLLEAGELFAKLRRRVALASDQTPQYAPIVKAGHEDGEFLFVAK